MRRRRRFSQTPPAKYRHSTNRSPVLFQTRSAGSNLIRGVSSITPRIAIVEAARRSSSRKTMQASSSRQTMQAVRRTLQFEEKTPKVVSKESKQNATPSWLGVGDRFQRYVFGKRAAVLGIPVPCTEGQWHAARMYDDLRNGHSYVLNQWIAYLKAKGVLVHENFEAQLKFDPIPVRIGSLLATGIDSVRVIDDLTKDSKRNANLLSAALRSIASESSRLTQKLNRGRRKRRNAVASVPVGIVSPSSRRRRRHHHVSPHEAINHCSRVYSFRQACDCLLSLQDGELTSTPQNQQEVRSPFSFRSRIKTIKISIGPNAHVETLDSRTFSVKDRDTEMRFRCGSLEDRTQWVRSIRVASRRCEDDVETQRSVREETEYLLKQLQ